LNPERAWRPRQPPTLKAAKSISMVKKARMPAYQDLVDKLAALGVRETDANLRNKISRCGVSAAFSLQVLKAIGAHTVGLQGGGLNRRQLFD
jgi:hypothetical protein